MKPDEVSAALGLKPSDAWSAGDPHRILGKKREESFWRIESRIARGARVEIEEHVKDVLEQLVPCFDAAASLSRQHRGLIELVGYFHEYYPGLGFEASTIQRLAVLGVEVDCDFYYLASEEAQPTPAGESRQSATCLLPSPKKSKNNGLSEEPFQ